MARLSPQKAHEVLFAAMAALTTTHPHARLVVIGGGVREQELRDLSVSLGIQNVTRFLGVRDDVERLLPGLEVSCLSSVHDGAPIAIIESMAAALPIVTTDCGSLRDLVTDTETGFIVPSGRRAVCRASPPSGRRRRAPRRLGAAGRRRAERDFQISGTARLYWRFFVESVEHKLIRPAVRRRNASSLNRLLARSASELSRWNGTASDRSISADRSVHRCPAQVALESLPLTPPDLGYPPS